MANTELRVVFPPDAPAGRYKHQAPHPADPEEGRRLVSAFWRITDPGKRAWLIKAAERLARG